MGRPILFLLPGILLRGPLAALVCVCLATPATAQTSLCCPADLDGDGVVGAADLALVVGGWGTPQGDVDGDGATGPADLALLLGAWGTCATEPCLLTRVVGRVVFEDGAPAGSAVIVTNEGGKGVSGADGAFSFDVEVEKETSELQVTAIASVRGVTYAGTALASPIVLGGVTDAGEIVVVADAACEPSWLPTFGGAPGTDAWSLALATFPDGGGANASLFVGGNFSSAGGVASRGIARWDGREWASVGGGVEGSVFRLMRLDDGGSDAALIVAGDFAMAGGIVASRIARWDGADWRALATSVVGAVYALAVFDDGRGGGPALYAAGNFTAIDGVAVNRIARWTGSSWLPLGSGLNGFVAELLVFDDGSGPGLFAAGDFTTAGGNPASRIAKWDGQSWTSLGSGPTTGQVNALAAFDDGAGAGPALYAGGSFTSVGGVAASRVARWNGSSWSAVGGGTNATVATLCTHDDGGGQALYAGGSFTIAAGLPASRIAKWDGSSWSTLGSGTDGAVSRLLSFDDGAGSHLVAVGGFKRAGDVVALHVARWSRASWSALGDGIDGTVHALATSSAGDAQVVQLYAGGEFRRAGGQDVEHIGVFDGLSWSPVGGGVNGQVLALVTLPADAESGTVVYAGGSFTMAGGVPANRAARWDGFAWSALGTGFNGHVQALTLFDGASDAGPFLYAGGSFTIAGGQAASRVAVWDGSAWSALGLGTNGEVRALAVHDDGAGAGAALYVGGIFTVAGGLSSGGIARWDGSAWSALAGGVGGWVTTLVGADLGDGPRLFVGGAFLSAGGTPANYIASWDGSSWAALGSGLDGIVRSLVAFDDGRGVSLFVGGDFTTAGGVPTRGVARWDGVSWSPVDPYRDTGMNGSVRAFTPLNPCSAGGRSLFMGGSFTASPAGDSFLAKWGCADDPPADGAR